MQPENSPPPANASGLPPEIPPLPVNYPGSQPETPPPPVNYPGYVPPPRGGMPVWGWILVGCLGCGCILVPVVAAILFPVFAQARNRARAVTCLSNLKQIDLGTLMYAQDYDERLPIAANWQTGIDPYVKNDRIFHCPSAVFVSSQAGPVGTNYAYNSALDMMKTARLAEPRNTVLTYDSADVSRNANDALTSLPSPGRHLAGNNISFADGHARFQPDSQPLLQGTILPDTR